MPIDYSKWKTIEVSDDEDDTHPNIDTPSLFRWRHQARLERMAEQQQAKEEVEKRKKETSSKMQEIAEKLKGTAIGEKERIALELERQTIKDQEEEFLRKEKELEEQERLQPWNVDTIGKEAWSKSIINKVDDKKLLPGGSSAQQDGKSGEDEDELYKSAVVFFDENEEQLRQLSMLEDFKQVEEFLLEHPHLCTENTTNWLTIEALNAGIEMDFERMDQVAENCITLQYLLELSKTLRAVATNTNMIKNFFKKINLADPSYMKMYADEVDAFRERLRKRANDKREAAINEVEAEAKAKRIAESPGGLDPQEVFDSLPEAMQQAFQTQSIPKMYEVAEKMDAEVFSYHLQRCIDSGLWLPNAKEDEEKKAADAKKPKEASST